MAYIDFLSKLHTKTKRDYIGRVTEYDKAECAAVAKKFGQDYWDGERKYGFGGYHYDGRWKVLAEDLINHYELKPGDKVLDVGCGKGFLLYEMKLLLPELEVKGIDISQYALEHAKEEVKPFLEQGLAQDLPYADSYFDLVFSNTTLHNLYIYDLEKAVRHIERVGKKNKYIVVEAYRNEREKANMLYWQLTCECFFTPEEWEWLYNKWGYSGDYSFIYFE